MIYIVIATYIILIVVVARVEFTLDDHGDVVWSTPPSVEVDGLFLTSLYRVTCSPSHYSAVHESFV